MADLGTSNTAAADHGVGHSTTTMPPNHLGTDVPSGGLGGHQDPEKAVHHDNEKAVAPADDDDDQIEDIDALIDDLESQDGAIDEEEEEVIEQGAARPVPEEQLNTDTRIGLTDQEVLNRRKKYGMNQMKEEKENLILKFLGYFVGPIQFVMEVSCHGRHADDHPSPSRSDRASARTG